MHTRNLIYILCRTRPRLDATLCSTFTHSNTMVFCFQVLQDIVPRYDTTLQHVSRQFAQSELLCLWVGNRD